MDRPTDTVASTDQVGTALANLTDADLARIKQIAMLRARRLPGIEWQDLLHSAIARSLAGTRRWPLSIPFLSFIAQSIRSVASEEWRRRRSEPRFEGLGNADSQNESESSHSVDDCSVDDVHPEREVLAGEALAEIEELFRNDPAAMHVLAGLALGKTPEETQRDGHLTKTEYASTQRRIRRRLAQYLLEY